MRRRIIGFLKEKDIPYRTDVPGKTLTTIHVGGTCEVVATPLCLQQMTELVTFCAYGGIPYAVIGRGSNLLIADGTVSTVLIKTDLLNAVCIGEGYALAQCGCSLPGLAHRVAFSGYADLAFAAGIPGSVGGAVYMNAGALGAEISSLVEWVEAYQPLERKIRTYFNDELSYSYRNSVFQSKNEVILQVKLRFWQFSEKDAIFDLMRQNIIKRRNSQPLHMPSAGSAFRRPEPHIPVGKLLDELGLKGLCCGRAAVSEKHAGFIVNLGGATAGDVKALIASVQRITEEKTGIQLVPEIQEIT
ncbi:MAG: UDP-N-acetylmuramate dehydrogenase [Ruminococcaceae bacterium]|nr:UDP-N-acetylmuramate dehydrogenase [Oscillospiraceae bacterium]